MLIAPAVSSGTRNDPLVMLTISPVKVVRMMPAMLEAKFWIPPIDATCAGVGATSLGRVQTFAPAKASPA
ncbi:MAG: hypothetical protein JOZ58_22485 [Acetobacteraceae bacterium]|nr:hypothetical protein [Acetobacteraceae bacterium]